MFSNVGRKIQFLAKAIMWFCIVLYIVAGFVFMFHEAVPVVDANGWQVKDEYGYPVVRHIVTLGSALGGIGIIIAGFISSWVGTFFTVGLGKIVEWVEHPHIYEMGTAPYTPEKEDFFTRTIDQMAEKRVRKRAQKETERRVLDEWYAQQNQKSDPTPTSNEETVKAHKYKCPKCGERIERGTENCPSCGQSIKWREEI